MLLGSAAQLQGATGLPSADDVVWGALGRAAHPGRGAEALEGGSLMCCLGGWLDGARLQRHRAPRVAAQRSCRVQPAHFATGGRGRCRSIPPVSAAPQAQEARVRGAEAAAEQLEERLRAESGQRQALAQASPPRIAFYSATEQPPASLLILSVWLR
jgi:hypothetical protein